jgi:hypothetical protein
MLVLRTLGATIICLSGYVDDVLCVLGNPADTISHYILYAWNGCVYCLFLVRIFWVEQ